MTVRSPFLWLAPFAVLLAAAAPLSSAQALELGDSAPAADVEMKNVDGSKVSIASAAGPKGTLVLFTCNHCPWVKAWEKRIARIGNDARKRGIGVIAVNSNDPKAYPEDRYEVMKKRAKKHRIAFPYTVDATSDVARAFGATRTPEAFLFDAEGALVYHGVVDDNARAAKKVKSHYLADAVDAVLAGKPVPVAETKALGCTIKFRKKK
jgi:peroxiredoxin